MEKKDVTEVTVLLGVLAAIITLIDLNTNPELRQPLNLLSDVLDRKLSADPISGMPIR